MHSVIGLMEPEIYTKMLRSLNEKLAEKFLVTTVNYSMVKISHLKDGFSKILKLETSTVEGQSLPQ